MTEKKHSTEPPKTWNAEAKFRHGIRLGIPMNDLDPIGVFADWKEERGEPRSDAYEFAISVFDARLEADEDNLQLRAAYAEWLDSVGLEDQAERQRKWPAAKAWLKKFWEGWENSSLADEAWDKGWADYNDQTHEITYRVPVNFTYETGMAFLQSVVDSPWSDGSLEEGGRFSMGREESLMYAIYDREEEFWSNYEIVTGVAVCKDREQIRFSCAC